MELTKELYDRGPNEGIFGRMVALLGIFSICLAINVEEYLF